MNLDKELLVFVIAVAAVVVLLLDVGTYIDTKDATESTPERSSPPDNAVRRKPMSYDINYCDTNFMAARAEDAFDAQFTISGGGFDKKRQAAWGVALYEFWTRLEFATHIACPGFPRHLPKIAYEKHADARKSDIYGRVDVRTHVHQIVDIVKTRK